MIEPQEYEYIINVFGAHFRFAYFLIPAAHSWIAGRGARNDKKHNVIARSLAAGRQNNLGKQ